MSKNAPVTRHRLDKKSFSMFCRRFGMFSDLFGLVNWETHIIRQSEFVKNNELSADNDNSWRALTTCSIEDKLAYVVVAEEWDVPFDNYWVSKTAFHESLEILLWPMFLKLDESERASKIHDVIRTLENTFFDLMYEKIIKNKN